MFYHEDSLISPLLSTKKGFFDYEDNSEENKEKERESNIFLPNNYRENSKDTNQSNAIIKEILTKATNYEEKTDNNQRMFENQFFGKENYLYTLYKNTINNQNNINNINNEKEDINERIGKKRRRAKEKGNYIHNKFSDDNLRRVCKHLVLKNCQDFINDKISEKYRGKIGKGIFTLKLLTLNQRQKSECSIHYNKMFLYKTLGDIISDTYPQ